MRCGDQTHKNADEVRKKDLTVGGDMSQIFIVYTPLGHKLFNARDEAYKYAQKVVNCFWYREPSIEIYQYEQVSVIDIVRKGERDCAKVEMCEDNSEDELPLYWT